MAQKIALTLVITCLAVPLARAQDAADPAVVLDTVTLTGNQYSATGPVTGIIAQTSATATKTDTPLNQTPASVSVVGAAEVAQRGGADNTAQAVAYAPGVFVDPSYNVSSDTGIALRGFYAGQSSYIDGLRVGTGATRAGQPSPEPFGVERFEVLRGPASVLYGRVAPGGIINIISKRALFDASRSGFTALGSHGRVETGLDMNGVNADASLGWRLVGLAQSSGTQIDDIDDNRIYLAPSLTWRPDDATSLTLLASWRSLRGAEWSNGGPRGAMQIASPDFNAGEPGFDRRDSDQWSLGYDLTHDLSDSLRVVQNLRFRRFDGDYDQVFAWNGLTGNPDRPFEVGREALMQHQVIDTFDVDTRLQWKLATGKVQHDLLLGVDYSHVDERRDYRWGAASALDFADPSRGTVGPFGPAEFDNYWTRELGIYVQDSLTAGAWHATGGLRWSRATGAETASTAAWNYEQTQETVVGNLGLLYETASGVSPYVSYAQSFEMQIGTDAQGNPFDPTEGEQYELGVKYQPDGGTLALNAAIFQLTQSNLLTTDPDSPDFSKQVGEVRMRGLELEARAERGDFSGTLAYTYLQPKITRNNDGDQGNDYSGVPRHALAAWLNWEPSRGRLAGLRLGGGLRVTGDRWGDDANTIRNDGQVLVDLAMGYDLGVIRPNWDGMRVDLNLNNLGADDGDLTCTAWSCEFLQQPTAKLTLAYAF